jgi:hypothetical protein
MKKEIEVSTFDKAFWKSILPFIFLVIFILFLPYLITSRSWFGLDFSDSGAIGDTLGGIIGPFIAIVAAFLTYMAFWVQYKANVQLRNDIQIDRLENRIYEMLNLHAQNVNELELVTYIGRREKIFKGRNIFPHLFYEFRRTHRIVEDHIDSLPNNEFLKRNTTQIAYLIFFIGIREENRNYLSSMLKDYMDATLIDFFIKHFDKIQEEDYINSMSDQRDYDFYKTYYDYQHFNGYASQLGHYFRHLYQTVKYLAEYPEQILSSTKKYMYIKTIRAQLSNHEQLILYYNALSTFGSAWIDNKYLTTYKMIKNIPLPLIDFGEKPELRFAEEVEEARKKGEEFFEWSNYKPTY